MLVCAALTQVAPAYSVLTHEQVVDLLWKDQIEPLLKKRFPEATARVGRGRERNLSPGRQAAKSQRGSSLS